VPQITATQLAVATLIAEGRVRLADGTLISRANYPGYAQRSHFAGAAAYGYTPSHSRFVWGMRLVLVSDPKGVPVGYELVGPKTGQERGTVVDLACGHPGTVLFCDKGLWGRELESMLEFTEVHRVTPERHRLGERRPAEIAKHASGSSSNRYSPISRARCASTAALPRPWVVWSNGSRSRCSRSAWGSSATCSPAAQRGRSSPMTGAEPTSGL
jgi:hypothetical protein